MHPDSIPLLFAFCAACIGGLLFDVLGAKTMDRATLVLLILLVAAMAVIWRYYR